MLWRIEKTRVRQLLLCKKLKRYSRGNIRRRGEGFWNIRMLGIEIYIYLYVLIFEKYFIYEINK
jgi:hypothetical protein